MICGCAARASVSAYFFFFLFSFFFLPLSPPTLLFCSSFVVGGAGTRQGLAALYFRTRRPTIISQRTTIWIRRFDLISCLFDLMIFAFEPDAANGTIDGRGALRME